jgi:hypothetical protein
MAQRRCAPYRYEPAQGVHRDAPRLALVRLRCRVDAGGYPVHDPPNAENVWAEAINDAGVVAVQAWVPKADKPSKRLAVAS